MDNSLANLTSVRLTIGQLHKKYTARAAEHTFNLDINQNVKCTILIFPLCARSFFVSDLFCQFSKTNNESSLREWTQASIKWLRLFPCSQCPFGAQFQSGSGRSCPPPSTDSLILSGWHSLRGKHWSTGELLCSAAPAKLPLPALHGGCSPSWVGNQIRMGNISAVGQFLLVQTVPEPSPPPASFPSLSLSLSLWTVMRCWRSFSAPLEQCCLFSSLGSVKFKASSTWCH
mgnify:CR=1 FL=1